MVEADRGGSHVPELLGDDASRRVLVWRLASSVRAIASAPVGGGITRPRWVLNAQVPSDYARTDLETHLAGTARAAGCAGPGVGFLTAARVDAWTSGASGGVEAYATVGLHVPTWAAAPEGGAGATAEAVPVVGTVNVVVFVPARLSDAALVNAVITATEAKTQALVEHRVPGTGTASDAVCVLTDDGGTAEPFAGPRSRIGASLARAVHAAVDAGTRAWLARDRS